MSTKPAFLRLKFCSIVLAPLVLLAAVSGCGGGGPSAVNAPYIDASGAAGKAMEKYDLNSDSFIDEAELEKAPALKASMATLDMNSDGKVDENELVERVAAWQSTNVGITSITCKVLLGGRPLDGAVVTFDPEEFLGEYVQQAVGKSDMLGNFTPKIPKEKRPSPDTPPGLQLGFYRVRVSKMVGGKEVIPSRYNIETTLGQQVSSDDPAIQAHKIVFRVEKK